MDRFRDICQKPPENAWVGENNPIAKRKNAIFSKSSSFLEILHGKPMILE